MTPELPESPIAHACAVAERAAFHFHAHEVALDELAQVLATTDLEDLARQVRNLRERSRPAGRWLDLLPARLIARDAP